MFNNNKKEKSTSMNAKESANNLPSINMISEGTELDGTITTENDVRIAGAVDGKAKAEGKVIVSSTGNVKGNIEADDADIAGNVDGELRVTNKLVLRKSAVVEGDIYTKSVLAEEGAQINGAFHMSDDITKDIKNTSANGSSSKKSKANKSKKGPSKKKTAK